MQLLWQQRGRRAGVCQTLRAYPASASSTRPAALRKFSPAPLNNSPWSAFALQDGGGGRGGCTGGLL